MAQSETARTRASEPFSSLPADDQVSFVGGQQGLSAGPLSRGPSGARRCPRRSRDSCSSTSRPVAAADGHVERRAELRARLAGRTARRPGRRADPRCTRSTASPSTCCRRARRRRPGACGHAGADAGRTVVVRATRAEERVRAGTTRAASRDRVAVRGTGRADADTRGGTPEPVGHSVRAGGAALLATLGARAREREIEVPAVAVVLADDHEVRARARDRGDRCASWSSHGNRRSTATRAVAGPARAGQRAGRARSRCPSCRSPSRRSSRARAGAGRERPAGVAAAGVVTFDGLAEVDPHPWIATRRV